MFTYQCSPDNKIQLQVCVVDRQATAPVNVLRPKTSTTGDVFCRPAGRKGCMATAQRLPCKLLQILSLVESNPAKPEKRRTMSLLCRALQWRRANYPSHHFHASYGFSPMANENIPRRVKLPKTVFRGKTQNSLPS